MKVREFYDSLPELDDEKRDQYCKIIFDILGSPMIKAILKRFEDRWNFEGSSWDEFKTKQNDCIKKCLDVELSDKAQEVRKSLNLSEFNWDTDLDNVSN